MAPAPMRRAAALPAVLLLFLGAASAAWPFNITLVHYNDWHNRVEANKNDWHELCDSWQKDSCSGGFARMKRFVDHQRSQDPNLVLLNAGDDFIGTVWDTKFFGKEGFDGSQPAAFMNLLRPDAMTIGNHEFDFGSDALHRYLSRLNYPVLGACNLQMNGHALSGRVQKYTTLWRQNVKICLFGLTSTEVSESRTRPTKVLDPYSSGVSCANELKHENCHVTILLSHLGYSADLYAAKVIPGIDLIVGGHSHSLLWNGSPPVYERNAGKGDQRTGVWGTYPTWVKSNEGRDVPIVTAEWGSRYMGLVKLTVDPDAARSGRRTLQSVSGWPTLLGCKGSDSPVDEDSYALDMIKKWKYW